MVEKHKNFKFFVLIKHFNIKIDLIYSKFDAKFEFFVKIFLESSLSVSGKNISI